MPDPPSDPAREKERERDRDRERERPGDPATFEWERAQVHQIGSAQTDFQAKREPCEDS